MDQLTPQSDMPTKPQVIDTLISAEQNRHMFNQIATRYDLMNSIISLGMHRYWRTKAVSVLKPVENSLYLDVGCGTGDVAIEMVIQSPKCSVIGIDPATEMLETGRSKVQQQGYHNISFQQGDCMALPFEDSVFKGVVTAFCIRNVTNRLKAMTEIRRVLKPSGRIVIVELTVPENRLVRSGHRLYSRCVVPFLGRLLTGQKAYRYLVDSVEDFPKEQKIIDMLNDAGFTNIQCHPLSQGIVTIFTGLKPDDSIDKSDE